jgi:hypothetical protein
VDRTPRAGEDDVGSGDLGHVREDNVAASLYTPREYDDD